MGKKLYRQKLSWSCVWCGKEDSHLSRVRFGSVLEFGTNGARSRDTQEQSCAYNTSNGTTDALTNSQKQKDNHNNNSHSNTAVKYNILNNHVLQI